MKTISFIEMKKFIIEKLNEFSIDEFYFEKHKYFIYSKEHQPKIDVLKLLDVINEEFDILYFWLDEKFIDIFFPLQKINSFHQIQIMTSEEKKKRNKVREILFEYSHKYYTPNDLINKIRKIENIELFENIEKIKEIATNKIENFKKWILNNLENVKKQNPANETNPFDYDIEFKVIKNLCNYKDTLYRDIIFEENNFKNINFIEFSQDLFYEVYPKYESINNFEWKSELINYLNGEIPNPTTFRVFQEIDFEKPKIAQINYDFKIEIKDGHIDKKIVSLQNLTTNDLFPIWNSLKIALITNEVSIDINNCFFVSLNNGIYAKIIVRKGKISKKNTVAFKYHDNNFIKPCNIFSGYTSSGFILPNGIYLNYKDLYFEIDFFANSLLLNNFNYNQQIQSISDKAKGDYDDYDD